MMVVYKANEVMKMLELKDSVFKKYISLLEKEGYIIQKNAQGHRLYTDDDVKTLENFIELSKYDGMTLEMVAKKIGSMKSHDGMTEEKNKGYDVMTLTANLLKEQEKQFAIRTQQLLDQQEKRVIERIESFERKQVEDHDKLLMQSIRESQEVKKMLLEVKEQIAATQEEKKSWWQFWK